MAAYYFDTSALVKRYVREPGSPWVQALYDPDQNHDLYTAQITGAELVAALYRRMRDKSLSKAMTTRLTNHFLADWAARFAIVAVNDELVNRAIHLIQVYRLRGYDAVHLAAAITIQEQLVHAQLALLTFVSADEEQLNAAKAEGLPTENPNMQ